jgi:hypothetical protein
VRLEVLASLVAIVAVVVVVALVSVAIVVVVVVVSTLFAWFESHDGKGKKKGNRERGFCLLNGERSKA